MRVPLFIHSPAEGHLDSSPFGEIMNRAAINTLSTHVDVNMSFHFSRVNSQEREKLCFKIFAYIKIFHGSLLIYNYGCCLSC